MLHYQFIHHFCHNNYFAHICSISFSLHLLFPKQEAIVIIADVLSSVTVLLECLNLSQADVYIL